MDTNDLFQWLNLLGVPAVAAYLGTGFIRKYRGKQTRAVISASKITDMALTIARQGDFIDALRADAKQRGYEPLNWPRNLRPKD